MKFALANDRSRTCLGNHKPAIHMLDMCPANDGPGTELTGSGEDTVIDPLDTRASHKFAKADDF